MNPMAHTAIQCPKVPILSKQSLTLPQSFPNPCHVSNSSYVFMEPHCRLGVVEWLQNPNAIHCRKLQAQFQCVILGMVVRRNGASRTHMLRVPGPAISYMEVPWVRLKYGFNFNMGFDHISFRAQLGGCPYRKKINLTYQKLEL